MGTRGSFLEDRASKLHGVRRHSAAGEAEEARGPEVQRKHMSTHVLRAQRQREDNDKSGGRQELAQEGLAAQGLDMKARGFHLALRMLMLSR